MTRTQDGYLNMEDNAVELHSISLESTTTPEEPEEPEEELVLHDLDYENQQIPENDEDDDRGKSSMKMAFMNMSNSILGAGIIGQPYATKNCGVVAGLMIFMILTFIIDWTIRLIIINCKLSGTKTYQDTAYKCFGKPGKLIILLAQGLFAIGGSIAFCIIIGDTIPHVFQSVLPESWKSGGFMSILLKRNTIIVLLTCFVSYPLSLTDNIAKLALSSLFALINMATIILIIVIHGMSLSRETLSRFTFENPFQGYFLNLQIFQGISVISFALVCHHNTSFIYDSLRKPTLDRFTKLTHLSCFISMICCALVGVVGDLIFKDNTKGNILNNFSESDWIINIARMCFGLNMLTTFPLEIFVVREVMHDLININKADDTFKHTRLSQEEGDNNNTVNDSSIDESSFNKRFVTTTLLVFGTMGVSLLTCNLGATLELIGSISASIMAFIAPVMCFMKLSNYKAKTLRENLPGYLTIIFGFLILIISSTQTIIQSLNEKGGGDHCKVG